MACVPLLLLLLSAAAAAADTYPLTGTVVNAVTGEPLRRAIVGIQFLSGSQTGALNQTVTADAGGRFEFAAASSGKYLIWAEHRGFARKNATQEIAAGPSDVTLRLIPNSAVTGKVVDENGDPIMRANIQVLRSQVVAGQRSLQPAGSASTNDLGEYRVSQLPPGRYYVGTSVHSGAAPGMSYGVVYYAATPDFTSATPLELMAGAEARADFRLEPSPAYTVRGRVQGAPPEASIILTLNAKGAADMFSTADHPVRLQQATGEFEITGVRAGSYELNAIAFRGGDRAVGSLELAVGKADLEGLSLVFRKPSQITGTVRVEDQERGSALDANRIGVILRPRAAAGLRAQPSARLLPDKTFLVPDVASGDYILQVTVPEPYYLKSALFGGVDASVAGISIGAGAAPPPLDIVIGAKGAEVSGTVVKDDKPAPNCAVLLIRSRGWTTTEKIVRADAAGRFEFSAVAPGDYTVYAWDDVNEIEYRNPDVLQRYWGENVLVSEGGKSSVKLKWNAQF